VFVPILAKQTIRESDQNDAWYSLPPKKSQVSSPQAGTASAIILHGHCFRAVFAYAKLKKIFNVLQCLFVKFCPNNRSTVGGDMRKRQNR